MPVHAAPIFRCLLSQSKIRTLRVFCGAVVFVDQSGESVAALDFSAARVAGPRLSPAGGVSVPRFSAPLKPLKHRMPPTSTREFFSLADHRLRRLDEVAGIHKRPTMAPAKHRQPDARNHHRSKDTVALPSIRAGARHQTDVVFPPKRDSDPLCRASRKGRSSQAAGGGAYRLGFAPARSTPSERPDESVEPMRAPAGLPGRRCDLTVGFKALQRH
jgi:hypothetical protein